MSGGGARLKCWPTGGTTRKRNNGRPRLPRHYSTQGWAGNRVSQYGNVFFVVFLLELTQAPGLLTARARLGTT